MADIVTVQDGLASDPNTWSPSKPNAAGGDHITVSHLVDFDEDFIFGDSPATAETKRAVAVQAGGRFRIMPNVTITMRGRYSATAAQTIMEAGSTWRMDPTQASDPSDAFYPIEIGTTPDLANNKLIVNGTLASPCTIETLGSGTNSRSAFTRVTVTCCQLDAQFLIVKRMNDTSNNSAFRPHGGDAGAVFRWLGGAMDDSGEIASQTNLHPDFIMDIENVTITNPVGTHSIRWQTFNTLASGKRTLKQCAIEGESDFGACVGITCDEVTFNGRYNCPLVIAGRTYDSLFQNCLIVQKNPAVTPTTHPVKNCFLGIEGTSNNPHGFQQPALDDALTIEDTIIQVVGSPTSPEGDMILTVDTASPQTCEAKNIIVLRTTNGLNSGTVVTMLGNISNCRWRVKNCTVFNGGTFRQGVSVAESGNGATDQIEVLDSIFIASNPDTGLKVRDLTGTTSNIGLPANLDYNVGVNQQDGSNGKGYDNMNLTSSPGANDIDEDPAFVEYRDAAAYDAFLGGLGTWENLVSEFMKRNTAGYNPAYNTIDMLNWIRQGLAPTNQNLKGSGSDGSDRGAVPVVTQQLPGADVTTTLIGGNNPLIS